MQQELDYTAMRKRDLERRQQKAQKHHAQVPEGQAKFDALATAVQMQRAVEREQRNALLTELRTTKERKADVERWLAGVNLAPNDRRAYEKELESLTVKLRWANNQLDKLHRTSNKRVLA